MRIKLDIEPIKLNLGCGKKHVEGYVGIDIREDGQEILWDITKGIPLPDNSVEEIISSHVVEHISMDDIDSLIKEMIRVSRNGAVWAISCPHADSLQAYYACHVSLWDERRWEAIVEDMSAYEGGNLELIDNRKRAFEIITRLKVRK